MDEPNENPRGSTFAAARWAFTRLIGLSYLIAFASLGSQVLLLMGSEGLLPASDLFDPKVHERWLGMAWIQPTVFRWGHSDAALQWGCWAGCAIAALLVAD